MSILQTVVPEWADGFTSLVFHIPADEPVKVIRTGELNLVPAGPLLIEPFDEKITTLDAAPWHGTIERTPLKDRVFGNAEGSWEFYYVADGQSHTFWDCYIQMNIPKNADRYMTTASTWTSTYHTLLHCLQGRRVLVDVPDGKGSIKTYKGRCWVSGYSTDLATPQMKNVAIKAGEEKTFTLVDSDKPSAVFVTSSGKAAAALRIQHGENVTLIEDACTKSRVVARDRYGQKIDLRRTELVYPVTVKDYPLQMASAAMYLVFSSAGAKSLTFYVRKVGLSTTLSSCRVVTSVADYEVGNIKEVKADWTVHLEANTAYEFGVRSTENVEGMLDIGSAGKVRYESEYLQVALGDAIVSGIGGIRPPFGGALSFYAGSGVVVSPGARTDVAVMTGGVSVNRYEVVVKAEEDANVTVEYRPAFL